MGTSGNLLVALSACMILTVGFCAPMKGNSGLYVCGGADDAQSDQIVKKWPKGVIPYAVSSQISAATRVTLTQSMHYWENSSCVIFIPQTNQQDYVQFESGNKCCSSRGHRGHGMQAVILDNSCTSNLHSLNLIIQQLVGNDDSRHGNQKIEITDTNLLGPEVIGQQSSASEETTDLSLRELCNNTCGGYFTLNPINSLNTPQTITSPGYPDNYLPHSDCVWKLSAPEGYFVEYSLKELDIEEDYHRKICKDFLDVFNLDKEGEMRGHRHLCGRDGLSDELAAVQSAASVVLRFHSDDTYGYRGFKLQYELKVSPTPCTMNTSRCEHYCFTDSHNGIVCSCREGYTLAKDGRSCVDVNECAVKRGGCDQRCRNTAGSFYCVCKPGFRLDADGITCHSCEELHNSSSGEITSLGYSSPYPPYQNCLWTLMPWPDHHLRITIAHVDIVQSKICKKEYVKIEHGHFPHQRRLCGYYNNISYYIDKNTSVKFHSEDLNTQHSGFHIRYKQVPTHELVDFDVNFVIVNGNYVNFDQRLWVQSSSANLPT